MKSDAFESGVPQAALTQVEQGVVLRQLELMLDHKVFRKSTRCKILLRYLVESALQDPDFHPKERTLGIEVFGRSPDYDTASDPIVRTAANEIRKRLGLYFHEIGADVDVLIEIPSGFYTPKFTLTTASDAATSLLWDPPTSKGFPVAATVAFPAPRLKMGFLSIRPVRRTAAVLAVTSLLIFGGFRLHSRFFPSNADRFWRPFVNSSSRVLVCTPNAHLLLGSLIEGESKPNAAALRLASIPMITLNDSAAVWRVMSLLQKKQENILVRNSENIRIGDLRDGPAVIIGGFNNPWMLRLSSGLRYSLLTDPDNRTVRIVDHQDPSNRKWSARVDETFLDAKKDYALVSRYIDSSTGNPVIDIAGLGTHGTVAASEFVGIPAHLNALGNRLDGCHENMQFVLSTQVINGFVAEPEVQAIYCW